MRSPRSRRRSSARPSSSASNCIDPPVARERGAACHCARALTGCGSLAGYPRLQHLPSPHEHRILEHAASQWPAPRRTSSGTTDASLHQACGRVGAGRVRRHPGDLHRQCRRKSPGLSEGQGRGLADRRVRHAAARHAHPQRPRGRARKAGRTHARDPAPDRSQPARSVRPACARRTHAAHRLRRDPGRRRHAHRGDHRRLCRARSMRRAGCASAA